MFVFNIAHGGEDHLTVFAERVKSLIFCTILLLFLKFAKRCSEILMNNPFIYSPSVKGFPCLTSSTS